LADILNAQKLLEKLTPITSQEIPGSSSGRFHQHFYAQLLRSWILKAQKDSTDSKTFVKFAPRINFTNILQAAFPASRFALILLIFKALR